MTAVELSPLRVDRITGSRLPAILGLSPYRKREDVMRELVREHYGDEPDFKGNVATEWGRAREWEAIAEYELTKGIQLTKTGDDQETVVHPDLGIFAVTPDGLVGEDGVVEAKAPYRAVYSTIGERPDYWEQIQLQLACTGREWGDFCVWRQDMPIAVTRAHRNPGWLTEPYQDSTRYDICMEFLEEYHRVLDGPDAWDHRAPLVAQRTDPEWELATLVYQDIVAAERYVASQKEQAKAALIELTGTDRSTRGAGILVTRSNPTKGAVQWESIVKAKLPDLDVEPYRKEPAKPSYSVRESKIAI